MNVSGPAPLTHHESAIASAVHPHPPSEQGPPPPPKPISARPSERIATAGACTVPSARPRAPAEHLAPRTARPGPVRIITPRRTHLGTRRRTAHRHKHKYSGPRRNRSGPRRSGASTRVRRRLRLHRRCRRKRGLLRTACREYNPTTAPAQPPPPTTTTTYGAPSGGASLSRPSTYSAPGNGAQNYGASAPPPPPAPAAPASTAALCPPVHPPTRPHSAAPAPRPHAHRPSSPAAYGGGGGIAAGSGGGFPQANNAYGRQGSGEEYEYAAYGGGRRSSGEYGGGGRRSSGEYGAPVAVHFPSAHGPGPAYFPNPQGGGGGVGVEGEGGGAYAAWAAPQQRVSPPPGRAYSPPRGGWYQQYNAGGGGGGSGGGGGYPYNNAPAHTLMPSAAQGESYAFPQAGAGAGGEYGMPYAPSLFLLFFFFALSKQLHEQLRLSDSRVHHALCVVPQRPGAGVRLGSAWYQRRRWRVAAVARGRLRCVSGLRSPALRCVRRRGG